jgi:hypothetical protein
MLGFRSVLPALLLVLSGCGNAAQLSLPPPTTQSLKAEADGSRVPLETAVIVNGSPTGVYALIARGALNCWFGADGPLKPTHVFEAEAQPAASGGAAEIVLYERDETLRDKRGSRSLRVQIASLETRVRVGTSVIKIAPPLAQAMSKDVETWARGGSGCEVRAALPPPPPQAVGKEKAVGPVTKKR